MTSSDVSRVIARRPGRSMAQRVETAQAIVGELLANVPVGDPMLSRLEEVRRTMEELCALTADAHSVGAARHRATALDVNAIVRQMTPSLERLLGPFITLEITLCTPSLWAAIDRGVVEQAILGLIINARESLPLGGVVRMATRVVSVEEPPTQSTGSPPAGQWAMLEVGDNGTGIDQRNVAMLFEASLRAIPFDSSLSLATISAVVHRVGGHVILDRDALGATRLAAGFPLANPPRAKRSADGAGAVLVADADDWIRLSAARALRRAGYGVLEATDADTALSLLEGVTGSCVRVVVVDPGMLTLHGVPLFESIATEYPDVELLLTGDLTMPVLSALDDRAGASPPGIGRPVTGHDVVAAVRQLLPEASR